LHGESLSFLQTALCRKIVACNTIGLCWEALSSRPKIPIIPIKFIEKEKALALRKIARMGHPVLRTAAQPVADPPSVAALAQDMRETMIDARGVGLAAPQVHEPLRLILFFVPPSRAGDPDAALGAPDGPVGLTVLINPEIVPLGDEIARDWEGCLSVPGLTGLVPRYRRIQYRGLDLQGRLIEREARGFHARVVQHECDHLDGRLYLQQMDDLSTLSFVDALPAAGAERG
jgi:peptide deformylase